MNMKVLNRKLRSFLTLKAYTLMSITDIDGYYFYKLSFSFAFSVACL